MEVNKIDFLRDGESKHGGDVRYIMGAEFKATQEDGVDPSLFVEGWANTIDLDRVDDIVLPTAFASTLSSYMQNPLLLFMHDWYGVPIGKVVNAEIRDRGLWIKAQILPTEMGEDIILLIQNGVLKSFSIGFRIKKQQFDNETGVRTITDLELLEISVVNIPANPAAIFDIAKSKSIMLKTIRPADSGGKPHKEVNMANVITDSKFQELESMVGDHKTALETYSGQIESLQKNIETQQKLLTSVREQSEKLDKGQITKSEYDTFTKKIGEDILMLQKSIEEAQNARKSESTKTVFKDWRSMLPELNTVRDDSGNPMSLLHQKAYHIFNAPVTYDGNDGRLLKMVRDLHDSVLCITKVFGARNQRFNVSQLKTYSLLQKLVGEFDPEFAKAMYSTGTGLGDEWVPTNWSAEYGDLYRLLPTLENRFTTWDMPSNPAIYPILSGAATAYIADEAAVNDPAELQKSGVTSNQITFTARNLAVAIPVSPELIEDSIVAIVPLIRAEAIRALSEGTEEAIVNGDTTATHQDKIYGGTTTKTSSMAYAECLWKGLRKIAVGDSKTFTTASTSTGVGDATAAFAAADLRYGRKLLGVMGINQKECVYVLSPAAYFKVLSFTEVATLEKFGPQATYLSGQLTAIDGTPIHISSHVREDLNTSGVYDGSTLTQTGFLAVNTTGVRVGQRRQPTLEFEKNIRTQQWTFVATQRKDFQKVCASTRYPVSYGYAITA